MRLVIAGASGFLGSSWSRMLTDLGHEVVQLVRREPHGPHEVRWDPSSGQVDRPTIESADVVVNLAGSPLVRIPWTDSYAHTFRDSRVETTRVLAEAVAASARKPTLLAQSGVAGYGDRGKAVVTEETPVDADSFMAEVVRQWESATEPAATAGARVVNLRTSVVLDRRGGALRSMLLPFRLGLGGRIGSGQQYFATISLHDWMGAATHLALDEDVSGPVNLTGPDSCTNAEFTEELGRALHRPTVLPVPAFAVRRLGPIGGEMLNSLRAEPKRLWEAGYAFAHSDIGTRVRAALG